MLQTMKDLSTVKGMVSLRWFKNYMLNHPQRIGITKNIFKTFLDLEKIIIFLGISESAQGELPNIFDLAFAKWKTYPRFSKNA